MTYIYMLIYKETKSLLITVWKIIRMKRKHQFHCETCGSPCEIYKKGKKHRVLVCPKCGVIATNPLPLAAAAILGQKALKLGVNVLGMGKSKPKEEGFKVASHSHDKAYYDYKSKLLDEALR